VHSDSFFAYADEVNSDVDDVVVVEDRWKNSSSRRDCDGIGMMWIRFTCCAALLIFFFVVACNNQRLGTSGQRTTESNRVSHTGNKVT
jgi:hypothetical protein